MRDRTSIRLLVPAVLAVAGWNYCLPIRAGTEGLLVPIQLIPGIFLDDVLLLTCVCASGPSVAAAATRGQRGQAGVAALLICLLAAHCVLPGITGPAPLRDFLESCKLMLGALLLVMLAGSSAETAKSALRWMVIGMAAGTAVNLHSTFESDGVRIGVLPMLLGQNGPGTAMGICVCLSAWLAISGPGVRDVLISVGGSLPAMAGASISYSKIGMSCAFLGLTSLASAVAAQGDRKSRSVLRVLGAIIATAAIAFAATPVGSRIVDSLGEFVRLKAASVYVASIEDSGAQSSSISARVGYVTGTLEIMLSHPFGVGYSGFGTAIRETETYRLGRSPKESDDPEDLTSANPHATPLYYASAGGFIGLLLCLIAFGALLRCIFLGLGKFGGAGKMIALASCLAYAVVFASVPSLLRTKLLIGPAGAALALATRSASRDPSG